MRRVYRTRGVQPMRWQGRASLPLRQQGHAACRTTVLARMLALILLARHAFVRSNRTRGRTGEASVRRLCGWLVEPLAMAGYSGSISILTVGRLCPCQVRQTDYRNCYASILLSVPQLNSLQGQYDPRLFNTATVILQYLYLQFSGSIVTGGIYCLNRTFINS
jgi:hypothetical protein